MSTGFKAGFIALGLIGGSIAKNIRKVFPDAYITALNRSGDTLDAALKEIESLRKENAELKEMINHLSKKK